MITQRRRWAGLATVLVLGSAGCGGDDDVAAPVTYSATVAGVVQAADAFLATLDDEQKKQVLLDFSLDNATAWSNLPCGSSCRPGIQLGDLDTEELAAAKAVLKTAMGTAEGSGSDRVDKIRLADDHLGELQGSDSGGMPSGGMGGPGGSDSGYSAGTYFLAFLGTPSTNGDWQLHFGGHHLAVNLTYKAGKVAGAAPFFVGVEPTSWTGTDGVSYAPLDDMKKAMLAMTTSLSTAEQAKAKLSQTYSDVLVGPGEDGQFPKTKQGLAVSTLTAEQQKLVLAAVEPWVRNADDSTAAALLKTHESELDKTYIAWSGTTGLTKHADYVRVDGPSVWVEFVCQDGVVIRNQIHYHTVYRDHTRDYGGEFTFS
ncbi:DUF3500 domain-containing protein [Actinoplanes sp. NPDC051494]|uniref:DUF3500 domain-containing protein n=1 Tax=Actinoplanes sp. NPDC051494 TaxID=3363907 RepID=UPI00379F8079